MHKFKSTPTFTFKTKHKYVTTSNDPAFFPSPNAYNPEKLINHASKIKFAKAQRKQWDDVKIKRKFPGPGSHETKDYITDGIKSSMGRSCRTSFRSDTPSPGQYFIDEQAIKKRPPSFTIQKKTPSMHEVIANQNLSKPSPGDYEQPILNFKNSIPITMAKSNRKSVILTKNPGPGNYETEKSFQSTVTALPRCKFGSQMRKTSFSHREISPGPGEYTQKSFAKENQNNHRGFSCRTKVKLCQNKTPGPGTYESPILNRFKSAPSIRMAKSERFSFFEKTLKDFKQNPGPGTFSLQKSDFAKFKSSSAHSFSRYDGNYISEEIKQKSTKRIFPGSYSSNFINSQTKSQPKFTISLSKNRQIFTNIRKSPGPGDYNPNLSLINKSDEIHKLQKSQRNDPTRISKGIPGPGQYESLIENRLGRQFVFSKSQRINYFDAKKQKSKAFHETYRERQKFPNPPSYMNVVPKFKFQKTNV